MTGIDTVTAKLYEGDNVFVSDITVRNVTWQEELSRPGSATFETPLYDTATNSILARRIVKFAWHHDGTVVATFACRIVSEAVELAEDGVRWMRFESQPGLLSMLGDATIYPEYGLNKYSPADRLFGFMSAYAAWYLDGNWTDPVEATDKYRLPRLKTTDARWIGVTTPDVGVDDGVTIYARKTLTVTDTTYAWIVGSGDNFFTLFHNGEEIITPAQSGDHLAFFHPSVVDLILYPGDHLFAAKVANATQNTPGSPVGLILAIYEKDTNDKVIGVLTKTGDTGWKVHDNSPEPGWFRAQVLRALVLEAQDREVNGATRLTLGFTAYLDSDGDDWAGTRGNFSFGVGTENLADVVAALTEVDLDVRVDPATLTLNAYNRLGSDLSGSVILHKSEDGGNLKSCTISATHFRFTSMLTQLSDGTWIVTQDPDGVSEAGIIESTLTLGSAMSDDTAHAVARAQLAENSGTLATATIESSTLTGPVPYVDYQLGDSIGVPGRRGGDLVIKARVLAISVDATGDVVRAWPELVEDKT